MEKLKQILASLQSAQKLAESEVVAGEHYMQPVFRHLHGAIQVTQQRIDQLQSWADEQAQAKELAAHKEREAAKEAAAAAQARTPAGTPPPIPVAETVQATEATEQASEQPGTEAPVTGRKRGR